MKRLLITLLATMLLALPVAAQAQFTYTTNSGAITITGYTGAASSVTNVIIPATLNGYPVTSIGSYAFQSCTSLTNATIPSSVTNIGTLVFFYCTSLTNIAVDAANPVYSSVNGVLFDKAQVTLIQCPGGLASYTIPDSVTSIGNYAFEYCIKLTGVTIPDSVTSIGNYAFANCYVLVSVTTIPASVTSIGTGAFGDSTSLTNIAVDAANPAYSSVNGVLFNKAQTALIECPSGLSGSYAIPGSVTSIGAVAFQYCIKLTSVTIPASVTSIGLSAFDLCTSLTNIVADAANPTYSSSNGVLFNKVQTSLVLFPDGLGGSYTTPGSVTSIGDEAFIHCSLASVTITNSVTSIGNETFFNCNNLTSVTIGSGVTSLGYDAFAYCYGLTNLTFLGNAPSLGSQALTGEASGATVYYYFGTTGWSSTYGGLPTVQLGGTSNPPPGGDHALVAYYSFEDDNLAATDFSGNGNSLTNYYWFGGGSLGITANAAVGNYAAAFNDNLSYGSYYITTNASLLSTVAGSFSISLWLKTPQSSGNNTDQGVLNAGIVSTWQQNGVSTNYVVPMAITGTKLAFVTVGSGGTAVDTLHSVANVNVNQYIHVVVTRDQTSGQKKIYINGSLDSSDTATTDLLNGSTSLLFGYGHSTGFYGELDDIQLYSGVLSAGEVLQIYNNPGTTIANTTGGTPPPTNLTYTTNNGVITITGYTGAASSVTNVIIPATINGYPVTTIGNYAFDDCTNLTNVMIPNSVTSIGVEAFVYCSGLKSVTIPNSVTSIGSYAFYDCISLTSVTIGSGVTNIGSYAFEYCFDLTNLTFLGNTPVLGSSPFYGVASSAKVYYYYGTSGWSSNYGGLLTVELDVPSPSTNLTYTTNNGVIMITGYIGAVSSETNVVIPATINGYPVTSIGLNAFANCSSLTSMIILIPNSVTNIEGFAFGNCTSLTNMTIPTSVITIGDLAFYRCNSLTSVAIPASVTNADASDAFNNCDGLTNIAVDAANPAYSSLNGVFFNKAQTILFQFPARLGGNYAIPNGVTNIAWDAFTDCAILTGVTIPNSVTGIGGLAFAQCYSLTNVAIGNSVTSIEEDVFQDCTSLMNITVAVDNSAYSSLNGVLFNKALTTLIQCPARLGGSYVIPNSVTNIGDEAFDECSSLTNVMIPNSVTSIGNWTFSYCDSLMNVVIPNSVTDIGDSAFYGCDSLTSIVIPNSVTDIGDSAFSLCGLTSVTIGNSVTNIEEYAFWGSAGLTNITFLGNAPVLDGSDVFDSVPGTVYYYSGTTGWSSTYGGLPTVKLFASPQINGGSLGASANGFGFTISGNSNQVVVVEASINLVNWLPIQTNTLTGTSFNFSDSKWTNYPGRFYRVMVQ